MQMSHCHILDKKERKIIMQEKKNRIQFRICEVESQIEYFSEDKIIEGIKTLFNKIEKYCYILHDKDINEDGTPKHSHYHLFLQFNTKVDLSVIAKAFGQPENFIKRIEAKSYNGAVHYCIHLKEPNKFQYSVDEVKSNFDYKKYIEDLKNQVTKTKRLSQIREGIENGKIRRFNLYDYISMEEYARYYNSIERYFKYRDIILSKKQIQKKCIFITGPSGCGKTEFAKEWSIKRNLSCFVTGSSNDPLQGYGGEDVLVLDDLRGSVFSFSDLLKLLSNNTNTAVQSRYYNKLLQCEYIFITSVIDIEDFYKNVFEHEDEPIVQLKRRCSVYIDMDFKNINIYSFNKRIMDYSFINQIKNELKYLKNDKVDDYDYEQRQLCLSLSTVYENDSVVEVKSASNENIKCPEITDDDMDFYLQLMNVNVSV